MSNVLGVSCPACGHSDEKIQIEVRLWVNLREYDFDFGEESFEAVHKPEDKDGAACLSCGWRGTIEALEW